MSFRLFALGLLALTTRANPVAQSAPAAAAPPAPAKKSNCTNIQLIIARGTEEPGTFGQFLGDPFYAAVVSKFGSTATVSGYAVQYPADLACNSESIGVTDTVSHLVGESSQCPQQVFALVGYSQGADLMHNATITLNNKYPNLCSKIVALTMFGDPGNRSNQPQASPLGGITFPFPANYARKLMQNCNFGDPVCSFTGTNVTAHLSYAAPGTNFIPDSANYVFNQYKTHGNYGPEPATYGGPGGGQPTQPTPGEIAALEQLGALLGKSNSTNCP